MDVLASGPVVRQAQDSFELYWHCDHVRDITEVFGNNRKREDLSALRDELTTLQAPPQVAARLNTAMQHNALTTLRDASLGPYTGDMHFFADHPDKIDTSLSAEEKRPLLLYNDLNSKLDFLLPLVHK